MWQSLLKTAASLGAAATGTPAIIPVISAVSSIVDAVKGEDDEPKQKQIMLSAAAAMLRASGDIVEALADDGKIDAEELAELSDSLMKVMVKVSQT